METVVNNNFYINVIVSSKELLKLCDPSKSFIDINENYIEK
jgi:hypothetical protein